MTLRLAKFKSLIYTKGMKEKLLKVIKQNKLFNKGDRVCVAVSGGADSVALFVLLSEIKREVNIEILGVHVNHHIRGVESDKDADFVLSLGEKLGERVKVVDVDAVKYSKANKYTLEQGARILRYNAFKTIMAEENLNKLALAHHKSDQAETVLMHMFRGCGSVGLVGMEIKSGEIVRLLLGFTKEELEDYLKTKNISWREDKTNKDTKYARNYIRHEIMPRVEEVYKGATSHIARLSNHIKRDNDFIDGLIPSDIMEVSLNKVIIKREANNLHDVLKERIIKRALDNLSASVDVFENHYNSILSLMGGKVGKKLDLPNNILVYNDYKGLTFEKKENAKFDEREFICDDQFEVPLGVIKVEKVKTFKKGADGLFVALNDIPCGAKWRKLMSGDKFTKFGGGTKSVVDYLTDKKIGSETRKKMVVLASGGEVLVIPGVEISDKVKTRENMGEVVKICLKV